MKLTMTVSPDFTPVHIAGWYIFNTWLQRTLDLHIHLEMFDDFECQRAAIARDEIDLIYANPYDASMLVREKGFSTVAAPIGKVDEAVVAVLADSKWARVEDLRPGTCIAATDDPDVNMIGRIMLEPADLNRENTQTITASTYVLVAKSLLQGKADVGFFLREAFDDLSRLIRSQLRVLVASQIYVVRHVLLASPRVQEHHPALTQALLSMGANPKGAGVLEALGLQGWEAHSDEDTQFMIDLIETLVD